MSVLYIKEHEDALVKELEALDLFRVVSPIDKKTGNKTPQYPAAFVCFVDDALLQDIPRPIYRRYFQIFVLIRDLRGEEEAKESGKEYLDAIDERLSGSNLGFKNLGPLVRSRTLINGYEKGILGYVLQYQTTFYRSVPSRAN